MAVHLWHCRSNSCAAALCSSCRRAYAALLDAAVDAVPNASVVPSSGGEAKRYNHTFTGGHGKGTPLGKRWRFPFPFTSLDYKGLKILPFFVLCRMTEYSTNIMLN